MVTLMSLVLARYWSGQWGQLHVSHQPARSPGSRGPRTHKRTSPSAQACFKVSACFTFANVPLDKAGHTARLDSRGEETDFTYFFLNKSQLLMGRFVMLQAGEVLGTIIHITYQICLFCCFVLLHSLLRSTGCHSSHLLENVFSLTAVLAARKYNLF